MSKRLSLCPLDVPEIYNGRGKLAVPSGNSEFCRYYLEHFVLTLCDLCFVNVENAVSMATEYIACTRNVLLDR